MRELSLGSKRRGSVGTGVSEVMILLESEQLGVRISDVKNIHIFKPKLQKIHNYLQNFINEKFTIHYNKIWCKKFQITFIQGTK